MVPVEVVLDEIILITHRSKQYLRKHILVGYRYLYSDFFPKETLHFRKGPIVGFRQEGREEWIVAVGPTAVKFFLLLPFREAFLIDFSHKRGGIPGVCNIIFVDEREGDQHRIFSERKPRIGIDMSEPIPGE